MHYSWYNMNKITFCSMCENQKDIKKDERKTRPICTFYRSD